MTKDAVFTEEMKANLKKAGISDEQFELIFNYVVFKINQFSRLTGIEEVDKLQLAFTPKLKQWIGEAMVSLGYIK